MAPRHQRTFATFVVALACSSLAWHAGEARAATIGPVTPPTITVSIEGVAGTWRYEPTLDQMQQRPDGGYSLAVPTPVTSILGNRATISIQGLEFDPDPFVLNNILVTNTTTSTQIFSAFVGLPTVFAAPNTIFGNVLTNVIDGGGAAGATIATTAGGSIYAAQIDGGTVATLQNDPFSVVAPAAGSNSSSASFGPNANAVAVTSNIGIQLRFSLTPGDTAAILSRFDVERVPEPSTVGMSALAMMATVALRRWRRNPSRSNA